LIYRNPTEDAAVDRLERRWFAAFKAASAARAECEALLDQMAGIETAWHHARTRLAEMEAIRDALGEELVQMEGLPVLSFAAADQAETYAA
jgi:hypothetical protein